MLGMSSSGPRVRVRWCITYLVQKSRIVYKIAELLVFQWAMDLDTKQRCKKQIVVWQSGYLKYFRWPRCLRGLFHMMKGLHWPITNHNRPTRPRWVAGVAGGERPRAESGHDSLGINQSECTYMSSCNVFPVRYYGYRTQPGEGFLLVEQQECGPYYPVMVRPIRLPIHRKDYYVKHALNRSLRRELLIIHWVNN